MTRQLTTRDLDAIQGDQRAFNQRMMAAELAIKKLRASDQATEDELTKLEAEVDALREEYDAYLDDQAEYIDDQITNLTNAFNSIDQRKVIGMSQHIDEPARNTTINMWGSLDQIGGAGSTTIQPATATTMIITKGTGKLILRIDTNVGTAGTITISGTSVDRETGVQTPGDTEVLPLPTAGFTSTNASTTDAAGNTVFDLEDCLITTKWWTGIVTGTGSTGVDLTATTYHCSFEQFNDGYETTVETFDANVLTVNGTTLLYAYLYHVFVTSRLSTELPSTTVDIKNLASLSIPSGSAITGRYWRLRQGNIDKSMDTTKEGIFVKVFPKNPIPDIEDLEVRVWATQMLGPGTVIEEGMSAPATPGSGRGNGEGFTPSS